MTAPPPRCPWWKTKRTWAAVIVWLTLPAAYVAAYRELMRPKRTVYWSWPAKIEVDAGYPHPVLDVLFTPAEWADRRLRPAFWKQ